MKNVQLNEEQMVTILREAGAAPMAEVAKKYRVSDATIYGWRERDCQLSSTSPTAVPAYCDCGRLFRMAIR